MQETVNPKENLESFDAIHYAALQVVIVASANGVSFWNSYVNTEIIFRVLVVSGDVLHDRRGILCLLFLFHPCDHCP